MREFVPHSFLWSPLPFKQSPSPMLSSSLMPLEDVCLEAFLRLLPNLSCHYLLSWSFRLKGSFWNVKQMVICLLQALQTSPLPYFFMWLTWASSPISESPYAVFAMFCFVTAAWIPPWRLLLLLSPASVRTNVWLLTVDSNVHPELSSDLCHVFPGSQSGHTLTSSDELLNVEITLSNSDFTSGLVATNLCIYLF